MTVVVRIGRRRPRKWYERLANTVKGLLTFQENIWQMIKQSLKTAKKKANNSDEPIEYQLIKDTENEDMNYKIEWRKVIVQATKELEKEEYEEAQSLYDDLEDNLDKDFPKDKELSKHLDTDKLSNSKIEEAYEKGYGATKNKNISDKLLEMGILTHVEWIKDFDSRDKQFVK